MFLSAVLKLFSSSFTLFSRSLVVSSSGTSFLSFSGVILLLEKELFNDIVAAPPPALAVVVVVVVVVVSSL